MSNDWRIDADWSAIAFQDWVRPHLENLIGGRIIHVEALTDDLASSLDMQSGIDAVQLEAGAGIRGIGVRIQECPLPGSSYDTYTIRRSRDSGARTEYAKLVEAIEANDGRIYPYWTIQAYVTAQPPDGQLRCFGVAYTRTIVTAIEDWEAAGQPSWSNVWPQRTSNASFYVVRWEGVSQHIYIAGQGSIKQLNLL